MTTTDITPDGAAGAPAGDQPPADVDYSSASAIQAQDVSFADFGVREEIVRALSDSGITHPFPIQAMTLPVALQGHDIIGQAKTGTGKTLGFGVPLLHRVVAPGEPGFDELPAPGKPQALVVAPTRELASQVARDLETASKHRNVRIVQIYGGRAYEPQIETLNTGVEVVVGTPGRMVDLLNQGHLNLTRAATVVLDEADEMLDLGFLPDVEKILSRTPAVRHTMLFSATMPGPVVSMARRYMSQPTHIRAADPDDEGATVKNTRQVVYRAHALDKVEVLARILQAEGRGRTIVFARTKRTAAKVSDELRTRGFAAGAIHGDLGQGAREQALRALRHGNIDVLVATDVAARGIDVTDVTHVVNYQCPEDERTYLHRIGRTGRAGNKGTAITFVDWDDVPRWQMIDRTLDLGHPEPVETYSSSPHLFSDLGIPEGTKGRLPKGAQKLGGLDAEELEDLGETGKRTAGGRDGGRGGQGRGGQGGRDGGRGGQGRGSQGRGGRSGEARRSEGQRSDGQRSDGAARPDDKPAAGEGSGEGQRRRRRRRRTSNGSTSADGA
ncbi:superfamily II DNA/RNA helicase [Isoptericola sp. CG 20/1183]|uniref:RNA helicase n=1 Tax=Isoptericola halotolerans TaxID=300560 RepID=A0ABX5EDX4_9MICO|nr:MULTISPECIES: DEAD/DEAH box helicase [Isoptericola]PRZ06879.1 superfamily II DNA/RNA helicase [Isoptericola halotolerans]PRZ07449.1 superfamily II DNA/RNA helicase [Isoptericola sp. CG 20/1183]